MKYLLKQLKDSFNHFFGGRNYLPSELFEASRYFAVYGPIYFDFTKTEGEIVATSKNFHQGTIVTSGKNDKEVDANIKDAILTAFEVPAIYADKLNIQPANQDQKGYALA